MPARTERFAVAGPARAGAATKQNPAALGARMVFMELPHDSNAAAVLTAAPAGKERRENPLALTARDTLAATGLKRNDQNSVAYNDKMTCLPTALMSRSLMTGNRKQKAKPPAYYTAGLASRL
jgi:hypothetical protein